jgi:hypothetical protein
LIKLGLAATAVMAFLLFQTPAEPSLGGPQADPAGPFANWGQVLLMIGQALSTGIILLMNDRREARKDAAAAKVREQDLQAQAQQREFDLRDRQEARKMLEIQAAQKAQEIKFELDRKASEVRQRVDVAEAKLDENTAITNQALLAANHVKEFKEYMARLGAIRNSDVRMGGDQPPGGVERRKKNLSGPDTSPENSGDTERK